MTPEDEGRRIAERAIQYAGQPARIHIEGLLEAFPSKGAARRALGIDDGLSPVDIQPWMARITNGMAGAHPALPNAAARKRPWWRRILDRLR